MVAHRKILKSGPPSGPLSHLRRALGEEGPLGAGVSSAMDALAEELKKFLPG